MIKLLLILILILLLFACKPQGKADPVGNAIVAGLTQGDDCDCGWLPGGGNVQWNLGRDKNVNNPRSNNSGR